MEKPHYHLQGVMQARTEQKEDFDGPLDVILLLLSKNKIAISDISITSILEQYLAYLDEMKRMDMEIASEFIAMASRLMLIKTKMLLSAAEQEEARSEMELLIRSLEERQRKDAVEKLQKGVSFLEHRNGVGLGLFCKTPEPLRRDGTYRYEHIVSDLTDALAMIADRGERLLPPTVRFSGIVGAEPYPVTKKAAEVLKRLIHSGVSRFLSLFGDSHSRSELVATFLAVIELCKLKSVSIEAPEDGEPIVKYLEMPEGIT